MCLCKQFVHQMNELDNFFLNTKKFPKITVTFFLTLVKTINKTTVV